MTAEDVSSVEKVLGGACVVYPVGSRVWRKRAIFSLQVMAFASLVGLGPSQAHHQVPIQASASTSASTSADSVAVASNIQAKRVVSAPASPTVQAQPAMPSVLSPDEANSFAPFVELGALDSAPKEIFDDFMVRVAQTMDLFTSKTGHEACGVVMTSTAPGANAWRVRLTTNRSHIGCVMVMFDEPGFRRVGTDIHSHPRIVGGVAANSQDLTRRPDFSCGQNIVIFDETFSEKDMDRGPGYLVSRNRLMFQRGRQYPYQQRAQFETLKEMPELAFSGAKGEALSQTAAAAWAGEDAEGLPSTHCDVPEAPVAEVATPADMEQAKQNTAQRRRAKM